MSGPARPARWYRSLYWRIAIGFVVVLAALLVTQALLFLWIVSRSGPALPGEPQRLAQTVAVELSQALETDPQFDAAAHIRQQYGRGSHPFFVMFADGRIVTNTELEIPEPMRRLARARLDRLADDPNDGPGRGRPGRGRLGRGDGIGGRAGQFPGDPFGAGPPPGRQRPVPVLVNGSLAAVVVVLPRGQFAFLLQQYAPTLALAAGAVLLAGAVVASIVIFGPARRRLRAVEVAAQRLGGGDLSARAPTDGADEVTAVATAFNSMAEDLAARAAALAAADRTRRQLLADVSHELNTPVTAMRGYLETLSMAELQLDPQTRARYLGIVSDETARLERIIGDLLELARLEGGGGAVVTGPVPVDELFARVAARHERAAADAGVAIRTSVAPGAAAVLGDRDRLEQALQNLAANALRYAPRGTSVDLAAARDGQTVTLTVTDHGPGIPAEHLARVFDRFYKAESSRAAAAEQPGGSGLGLSIVKAIVERHGGTIVVSSAPGTTTFRIAGLRPAPAPGNA